MPDLLGTVMDTLSDVSDHMETDLGARWLYLAVVAALPGMVAVLLVLFTLRRIVREAEIGACARAGVAEPNPSVLAEQRLANVVTEMAIAANIKCRRWPSSRVTRSTLACMAPDDESATVLVSSALLE